MDIRNWSRNRRTVVPSCRSWPELASRGTKQCISLNYGKGIKNFQRGVEEEEAINKKKTILVQVGRERERGRQITDACYGGILSFFEKPCEGRQEGSCSYFIRPPSLQRVNRQLLFPFLLLLLFTRDVYYNGCLSGRFLGLITCSHVGWLAFIAYTQLGQPLSVSALLLPPLSHQSNNRRSLSFRRYRRLQKRKANTRHLDYICHVSQNSVQTRVGLQRTTVGLRYLIFQISPIL